jgi:hypothetical protein
VAAFVPAIPKLIHLLWLQGRNRAPALVHLNLERWTALNPDYELRFFDQKDVDALLASFDLPTDDLPPQAISDLVRAILLYDQGGIWADASLFPVKPLDAWLPEAVSEVGFFAFERPGPDRLISSWFLVASPKNPILVEWLKEIKKFWSKPRRLMADIPNDPVVCVSPQGAASNDEYPYFWFHYLFQYTIENSLEMSELWDKCIKLSAMPPHQLQSLFANNHHPTEPEIRQAANAAPVQKLNWRTSYPLDVLRSIT